MGFEEVENRIDTFIKKLDNREIIIDPKKITNRVYGRSEKGFFKKNKEMPALSDLLSISISKYQLIKNSTDSSVKTLFYDDCLRWINEAYAIGAVQPSDGIYKKYEDCLDQIKTLTKEKKEIQEELQQVSVELLESEAERKSLKRLLDEEKNAKRS